jgi:predicted nucleotidyltransferase
MEYKYPRNTPRSTREVLRGTLSALHAILQDSLMGIYLCGSLAMGCFHPKSSDIDLILVVKERLTEEQEKKTIEYLKKTSTEDRRIELNIVRADVLRNPQYPMLVDLHYEYWGNVFENEMDSEVLSNLYTTRKRGFRVWGQPISKVFSRISAHYHLRSVVEDIKNTRGHLHEKPEDAGYNIQVYWVLGSCRILAFIREEKVLSKLEGGQWGLANLPRKYRNIVRQALSGYRDEKKECTWNLEDLEAFAEYMTNKILKECKLKELQ